MPSARRMPALLAAVATAVGLASCASGDESSPRRAAFVEKVDAACKKHRPPEQQTPRTRAQAQQVAERSLRFRRRALRAFSRAAASPPADLRDDLAEYRAKTVEILELTKRQVRAAKRRRSRLYTTLIPRIDGLFNQRERVAERIGFEICGQPQGA